jgi:hypothetical protein
MKTVKVKVNPKTLLFENLKQKEAEELKKISDEIFCKL